MRHNIRVAIIPLEPEPLVAVTESYRSFEPPPKFKQRVETLLRYVPPKYLVGLAAIVLTNRAGLTRNKRKQKVWSRNRKVRLAECLGSYSHEHRSSPATVWLYVDNIVEAEMTWWKWAPLLRYLMPAEVLYHEIGHHIHAAHRPIHAGKENIAEDWSKKLWARFCRQRYWYVFPFLYVCARMISPVLRLLKRMYPNIFKFQRNS